MYRTDTKVFERINITLTTINRMSHLDNQEG